MDVILGIIVPSRNVGFYHFIVLLFIRTTIFATTKYIFMIVAADKILSMVWFLVAAWNVASLPDGPTKSFSAENCFDLVDDSRNALTQPNHDANWKTLASTR